MRRTSLLPAIVAVAGLVLAAFGLLRDTGSSGASPVQVVDARVDLLVPVAEGQSLLRLQMLVQVLPGMSEEEAAAEAIAGAVARIPGAVPANPPGSVSGQYVEAGWTWDGGIAGWSYNDAGRPPSVPDAHGALLNAAATWNAAGANFTFNGGFFTEAAPTLCDGGANADGVNSIGWVDGLSGTTLALTCTIPKNGPLASESDIQFDANRRWSMEDDDVDVDFESVALHEFGHVLGLGHSSVQSSVMYGSYQDGVLKRELETDDLAGLYALYGQAPTPTPSPSPTATPSPTPSPTPQVPRLPLTEPPVFVPGIATN